jgi:Fe-S cluster assembly protein SufD
MDMNAVIRPIRTTAEVGLADLYAVARSALPGGLEIAATRAAAFQHFALAGLPSPRVEAWKYTDLRRLMRDAKPLAAPADAAAKAGARNAGGLVAGLGFRRLTVIDGAFAPELSDLAVLESGLVVRSMADALASDESLLSQGLGPMVPPDDAALALNTAFASDGVVIAIAAGVKLERPIHLAFITTSKTAAAMYTRSLLVIGHSASATLIETHEGPDRSDYQVNTVLQLVIGDEAKLEHVKITGEGNAALHIATLLANVGARAHYSGCGFTTGGLVVRNQLFVRLAGEATEAAMRGVSLLTGKQHADTTLTVEHLGAGSQSREVFKAVVDGEARSVFQGKITVLQAAQKTDAKMMTRALLLSDDARADSKPELEIFADDVQCGHGATVGALDDQLKFYLMARGIPEKEAEGLLIQAFVGEVLEAIEREDVRDVLLAATTSQFGGQG